MIYMIKRKGCIKTRSTQASFAPVTVKWTIVLGHQHGGGALIWLVRYYLSWEVEREWLFPSTSQAITVCEGAAQNKNNVVDFCQSQWLTGEIPANGSSCSCQLTLIWLAHTT